MKEDFLHYIWKFQKFNFADLKSIDGQSVVVLNAGQYTQLAGPDFFNALVEIDGQKWAGNIEIHLKSSDWYSHGHETDKNYENVVLHVVWEHDIDVFRGNNSAICVVELKNYVDLSLVSQFEILQKPKSWILCETSIGQTPHFVLRNWQERLFFERLERKADQIANIFAETNKDWEATLFIMMAKNFGLNTNGAVFQKIATSIPFYIVKKESFDLYNLEGLIFGSAGLLDAEHEDVFFRDLKFRYFYLLNKHKLSTNLPEQVQFFKHRPDNFPTIRLSQLANLYHKHQNLFSKIISLNRVSDIYQLFDIQVSDYWKTHYVFDSSSPLKQKKLSKSFIDLLVLNTIVPLQFAYARSIDKDISESLINILQELKAEQNVIIDKFKFFGISAQNAFESQSLLQLKNDYCNASKCLQCAVGLNLLKSP